MSTQVVMNPQRAHVVLVYVYKFDFITKVILQYYREKYSHIGHIGLIRVYVSMLYSILNEKFKLLETIVKIDSVVTINALENVIVDKAIIDRDEFFKQDSCIFID